MSFSVAKDFLLFLMVNGAICTYCSVQTMKHCPGQILSAKLGINPSRCWYVFVFVILNHFTINCQERRLLG